MPTTISVATYNTLAADHIRPEWFPLVKPEHFVTATRYPRVVDRVLKLDADILCLQEVDDLLFSKLKKALEEKDYRGLHTKYDRKPDGVATFLRWPYWKAFTPRVLRYPDAKWNSGKQSGRLGHVVHLRAGEKVLAVANAHLKWNSPETPPSEHLGYAQAEMLVTALRSREASGHIICGDLNVMPDDAILGMLSDEGFSDAHPSTAMTFNSSDAIGGARKIDYILHSESLHATPYVLAHVTDATPLPSNTEPSDHVPLVAQFVLEG